MDISAEIAAIQAASQGSELRQPLVGALNKLNSGALPAVTASDVGKILKVGANGWEVGEKSGYMPVPTATKQITENGTHDVTDYASAVVNISSGGGGSVLVSKTITQNGTYNPADDNADGYSEVTVNVSGGGFSDNDLLFHFEDFNNSGKLDVSFYNRTGFEISDEQSKFGTHSLKCGSTQTINNIYIDQNFTLGNSDFTLDFWVYPLSIGENGSVPISSKYRSLGIYLKNNMINVAIANSSGSSWSRDANVSVSDIVANQWIHLAVVRNGSYIYTFVNGRKLEGYDYNIGNNSLPNMQILTVGSNTYSSGDRRFSGYIDELRLKIDEAVWTSDFTPPTQPYV